MDYLNIKLKQLIHIFFYLTPVFDELSTRENYEYKFILKEYLDKYNEIFKHDVYSYTSNYCPLIYNTFIIPENSKGQHIYFQKEYFVNWASIKNLINL